MAISTKDSLDQLLAYAQRNNLATRPAKDFPGCHFPYDSVAVQLGNFAMQVHCHSTGNDVRVYILGAGDPYEVVNGTYWHSSQYDFNPFTWLHGAWDKALQEAQDTLRTFVVDHKQKQDQAKQQAELEKLNDAERRKREVEALFQ